MTPQQAERVLKLALICCGVIWSSSLVFLLLPRTMLVEFLRYLDSDHLQVSSGTEYAVRMSFAAFTLFGALYFVAAVNLRKYSVIVPWLGGILVAEGIILFITGVRVRPDHPWVFEFLACVFAGGSVLWLHRLANNNPAQ